MAMIGIACGGTGGHLFPGLAVADALTEMGHEVRLYVSTKPIDARVLKAYPQFPSVTLPTVGWPGLGIGMFRFATKLASGYFQSRSEISRNQIRAVLGMGGFTCAPLLMAGAHLKVPSFIHESNAIPGKVTRWLAPKVGKVLVGFRACEEYLPSAPIEETGTPVRQSLQKIEPTQARKELGLHEDRQTILVMGGSQGASGINQMLIRSARDLKEVRDQIQIIHLTGERDVKLVEDNYARSEIAALVKPFMDDVSRAYSASNLIIARAGASSLAEIGTYGLPALLVPYPHAAEDHQTRNAEVFEGANAARIVREGEAAPAQVNKAVRELLEEFNVLKVMGENARKLHRADAATRIAKEIDHVV